MLCRLETGSMKESKPMPLALATQLPEARPAWPVYTTEVAPVRVSGKGELDHAISNRAAEDGNSRPEDREVSLGAGFKCDRVGSVAQRDADQVMICARSELHKPDLANRCWEGWDRHRGRAASCVRY